MNVSTGGRRIWSRGATAALACAIILLPGPGYAAPGDPDPHTDKSIEDIRDELDGLYREAEVATEAYNAANEKAAKQEKRLTTLRKDLTRAEKRVKDLRDLAGAAARTQYRGGDLAATGIQLLLGTTRNRPSTRRPRPARPCAAWSTSPRPRRPRARP